MSDNKTSLMMLWGIIAAGGPQAVYIKAQQSSYIKGSAEPVTREGGAQHSRYALAVSPCFSKQCFSTHFWSPQPYGGITGHSSRATLQEKFKKGNMK